MLDNFPAGQIQHFPQGIVVGKGRLIFCDLPELAVQSFNDIGRIYDFPNLRWICEKGTQNFPIILPAFDTGGILTAPVIPEDTQVFQGFLLGHSGIDLLQVCHQGFDVLVADIAGGRTDLVDDTMAYLISG